MTLPGMLVLQPIAVALLAAVVLHERGIRPSRAASPPAPHGAARRDQRRQAWLFRLGAAVGIAVLVSPLDWAARTDLLARTAVEILLVWAVAPLLVLGAPWAALRAGLPGALRSAASGRRGPRGSAPQLGGPVVGVVSLVGFLCLWHVPAVLDATTSSLALRSVEAASALAIGVLLWSQVVGSRPFAPRFEPLGRCAVVAAALAAVSVLGAAMVFSSRSWYPAFVDGPAGIPSDVLRQQLAGALVWALPSISLGIAAFWCFADWLGRDDASDWHADPLTRRPGVAGGWLRDAGR